MRQREDFFDRHRHNCATGPVLAGGCLLSVFSPIRNVEELVDDVGDGMF
jgi:hypothetical protein